MEHGWMIVVAVGGLVMGVYAWIMSRATADERPRHSERDAP